MPVVETVQDNAHALPRGDERRDADEPGGERDHAPRPGGGGEGDEEVGNETRDDAEDSQPAGEEDAWAVAVADGPADEVGVGLPAESIFDGGEDGAEGGGVGGGLEGFQNGGAIAGGDVEFARGAIGDVDGDYTLDLVAVGLRGDCARLLVETAFAEANIAGDLQGFHFRPASWKAWSAMDSWVL